MLILFLALYPHISAAFMARVDSFVLPSVARLRPYLQSAGQKPCVQAPPGSPSERGGPESSLLSFIV
jgi:hypothetical protein